MKEFNPENKAYPLGSLENPIIDSALTRLEALRPNPAFHFSPEVFEKQVLLAIIYLSFDGKFHSGQIVVHKELEKDVTDFFKFLLEKNFSLNKAVPIASDKYNFSDELSMADNNSSGFNPRNIAGTERPSNHAFGRAIDINPLQNPFIKNDIVEPVGAAYEPGEIGTLTSEIVEFLKSRGWKWGGDYIQIKDYHHFEKPMEEIK